MIGTQNGVIAGETGHTGHMAMETRGTPLAGGTSEINPGRLGVTGGTINLFQFLSTDISQFNSDCCHHPQHWPKRI